MVPLFHKRKPGSRYFDYQADKEAVQKGMVLREEAKEFNVFSKHFDLWNKMW